MKRYTVITESQDDIQVGDTILIGKWKNRKVTVTGFGIDEKGQPTIKTDKGEISLYKFRIEKLMK